MARFDVRLHLTCGVGAVARQIGMNCSIKVCHLHRDAVAAYVLSDVNKETIRKTLTANGSPEPIFETAQFEFIAIPEERLAIHAEPEKPVRLAPCDRAECANPARWQIVQVVHAIGAARGIKLELLTNMCVCAKHRKETKPADFLDEESRATLKARLNATGILLPDIDRMKLKYLAIIGGQPADPVAFSIGIEPAAN